MITQREFVTYSIDLNLFFLRIMKEHSLFLELGFMPRDKALGTDAASFRTGFENLLSDAIGLAENNVSQNILQSKQIATQYTVDAERMTSFYSGLPIDTKLTERALNLTPFRSGFDSAMVQKVELLDTQAYQLTASLAEFKEALLRNVRECRLFTGNYPLLIDHILREARFFMKMLAMLMRGENIADSRDLVNQEIFWNRIMAEHSKFIAGLLDPTEETLIETARAFGKEFDALETESVQAQNQTLDIAGLTADTREQTRKLRDFKAAGTQGLLGCKIQSIIIPLLADHTLREANHYLCVLGECRG